ncbi:aminotransferase class III-fold pyridoxal phosphate-dependent enzyme [Mesorhizobium sp. P5_C1]
MSPEFKNYAAFIKANNARHILHPMISPQETARSAPLIISKGKGVFVEDIDGRSYLDAVGGLWNVNIGHGREEVKHAIVEQLDRIAYYTTFGKTSNPPQIELSTRLSEMLAAEQMAKVLFSSGGSDAVETALKLARQYHKLTGQPERTKFFSLKYGYHGVHFGGLSAGGNPPFRQAFEPLMPGFFQVDSPFLYRNQWTTDPQELGRICAEQLEREIVYQGAHTVAAVIAEPIQGAGGVIVPPENYWPLLREICDRHGVLLIADEIVTGFGRTGEMFGCRLWGVKPDIMCFAKGITAGYIPLGATMVSAKVAAAWDNPANPAPIMHGYTYSGHALACATATAVLDIVVREKLSENAAARGVELMDGLNAVAEQSTIIGDVRGRGLMVGVELVRDKDTKKSFGPADPEMRVFAETCLTKGVIVRVMASKVILSPPLTINAEQVTTIVETIGQAVAAVERVQKAA